MSRNDICPICDKYYSNCAHNSGDLIKALYARIFESNALVDEIAYAKDCIEQGIVVVERGIKVKGQWGGSQTWIDQAAAFCRSGRKENTENTDNEKDELQLEQLFLTSPETGNRCEFCSTLRDNGSGLYNFDVMDVITGDVWTHSVVTCERGATSDDTAMTIRLKKQPDGTLG